MPKTVRPSSEMCASGAPLISNTVTAYLIKYQCATLAAGPGPEASENVVGPVKKGPGPVKISLNYQGLLPPGPVEKIPISHTEISPYIRMLKTFTLNKSLINAKFHLLFESEATIKKMFPVQNGTRMAGYFHYFSVHELLGNF